MVGFLLLVFPLFSLQLLWRLIYLPHGYGGAYALTFVAWSGIMLVWVVFAAYFINIRYWPQYWINVAGMVLAVTVTAGISLVRDFWLIAVPVFSLIPGFGVVLGDGLKQLYQGKKHR